MTYKPPNTWQASCGRCKGSHWNLARSSTHCRQTRAYKQEDCKAPGRGMDDENTQLALRHWINQCPKYRDRDAHQQYKPKLGEFPSSEQIKREQLDSDYNSSDDPEANRMGFDREDEVANVPRARKARPATRKKARKARPATLPPVLPKASPKALAKAPGTASPKASSSADSTSSSPSSDSSADSASSSSSSD